MSPKKEPCVVDLLTDDELEIIRNVRRAEQFATSGWVDGWRDQIPRHPESGRYWVNLFTHYFFAGFRFQRHQAEMHYCPVPDIQIMGGVGSGKTTPCAMSAATRVSLNPGYRVLWVAPILPQARLAYEIVLANGARSRWGEVFLKDYRRHPYPSIEFRPWDQYDPGGFFECRSLGQDPAELLRGGEFDEAIADEAMRAYPTTWYIALISGRLRGPRPYMLNAYPELRDEYSERVEEIEWSDDPEERDWLRDELEEWVNVSGLARKTRLTVIGNAPRGAEWWKRWEHGKDHPEERYSDRWSTYNNLYVTRKQIALQEAQFRGREVQRGVELEAHRPPAGGDVFPYMDGFFSGELLQKAWEAIAEDEEAKRKSKWIIRNHDEHGLYHYEKPVEREAAYAFALDPGSGILGKRNQWVLLGVRIDKGPTSEPAGPWEMVYMQAGNLEGAHGSPDPWIAAAKDVRSRYPIAHGMFGVESSGVQKNTHWVVWRDDLILTPIFLNNVVHTLIIEAQRTIGAQMWWVPDCTLFADEMAEFKYVMKKSDPQDWVSAFLVLNHLVYPHVHDRFEAARDEEEEIDYWDTEESAREVRDTGREIRQR